jgi:hypothetical protein
VSPEVIRELDHGRDRGSAAAPTAASGGGSLFGLGASFTPGAGFAKLLGAGGGRSGAAGGSLFAPVTHVAVIGKNVTENTKSMPPVMMLEDD